MRTRSCSQASSAPGSASRSVFVANRKERRCARRTRVPPRATAVYYIVWRREDPEQNHHAAAVDDWQLTAVLAVHGREYLHAAKVVIECDCCALTVDASTPKSADDIQARLVPEAHTAGCTKIP